MWHFKAPENSKKALRFSGTWKRQKVPFQAPETAKFCRFKVRPYFRPLKTPKGCFLRPLKQPKTAVFTQSIGWGCRLKKKGARVKIKYKFIKDYLVYKSLKQICISQSNYEMSPKTNARCCCEKFVPPASQSS